MGNGKWVLGMGMGTVDPTLLVGFAEKIVYIRQPKAESRVPKAIVDVGS